MEQIENPEMDPHKYNQLTLGKGTKAIQWSKESLFKNSSQEGSVGRHGLPLRTTTSKLQLKYWTRITQKHQKSSWMEVWQPQNQIEWKWYNYRIKETTSIQTGKEHRNGTGWSNTHVDKNSGGISQEQGVTNTHQTPQPRIPVPGI